MTSVSTLLADWVEAFVAFTDGWQRKEKRDVRLRVCGATFTVAPS